MCQYPPATNWAASSSRVRLLGWALVTEPRAVAKDFALLDLTGGFFVLGVLAVGDARSACAWQWSWNWRPQQQCLVV